MSEPRAITLGTRTFAVPPLPIRINRRAYPLCRELTIAAILDRALAGNGALDCTEEEMDALVDLAFLGASAADPALAREAFDELPVTPLQLLDAFLVLRYQTGAWIPVEPGAEAGDEPGEAPGEMLPPT